MRACLKFTLIILSLSYFLPSISAQEEQLSKKYKTEVVESLIVLMNDYYVFPEVAKETEIHLRKQMESGYFDKVTSTETLAELLTKSVQEINKDKHMKVRKTPDFDAEPMTPERMIEEKLHGLNRMRSYNAGFNTVKVLEGNIGYIDIRGFAYFHEGSKAADAYMQLVANTDAIIIDLSKNGGGDPEMVQYLCSYFFEGGVHLNSLYFREGDRTMDFHTLDEVGGKKMIDIPLFVMTAERTFSGAEEFSYNMQTQKRATLIGQTTGGGANPGRMRSINEDLAVFIPNGKAINPITKTNWEGTGVIPEIKTELDSSFAKAHKLAKMAAEEYQSKSKEKYTSMYEDLLSHLEVYDEKSSESLILKSLTSCKEAGLIRDWEINALGYDYLMQHQKPEIALAIFKANIDLHPDVPNGYDSYAEALSKNGSPEKALKMQEKAIAIAESNQDPDIEMYKANKDKILEILSKENK